MSAYLHRSSMNSLVLKPTGSHYDREWSGDDFVVLRDGEVIGAHSVAPDGTAGGSVVLDDHSARTVAVNLQSRLLHHLRRSDGCFQGAIVRPLIDCKHSRNCCCAPKPALSRSRHRCRRCRCGTLNLAVRGGARCQDLAKVLQRYEP